MYRDDRQFFRAARKVLSGAHMEPARWVNSAGFTDAAFDEGSLAVLSSGERLMVRVLRDLWNSRGGASVGDLFRTFDNDNLRCLGELLVALADGPDALDAWIAA